VYKHCVENSRGCVFMCFRLIADRTAEIKRSLQHHAKITHCTTTLRNAKLNCSLCENSAIRTNMLLVVVEFRDAINNDSVCMQAMVSVAGVVSRLCVYLSVCPRKN